MMQPWLVLALLIIMAMAFTGIGVIGALRINLKRSILSGYDTLEDLLDASDVVRAAIREKQKKNGGK